MGIIDCAELSGVTFGNCRQTDTAVIRTTPGGLTRGSNCAICRLSLCRVASPWVHFPVVESPEVETHHDDGSNDGKKNCHKGGIAEGEEAVVVVVVVVHGRVVSCASVVRFVGQAGSVADVAVMVV